MTTTQKTKTKQPKKEEPASSGLKQAVVVIHGMGEQRPMETIRSFVNQVWKQDDNLESPHFWNKPSSISESFEQRRLTTDTPKIKQSEEEVQRTDFYEYYWAHHTVGTKWEHFLGWFTTLLLCLPSKYNDHPHTLKKLWFVLWLLILSGIGIASVISFYSDYFESVLSKTVVAIIVLAWGFLAQKARTFFTNYFGDVARYVRANPANIAIRQSIRKGGVELLERIHQTGHYDRIVLVGHSLGTIIAYDILTHLWARHYKFKYTKNGKTYTTPLTDKAKKLADELEVLAELNGEENFDQTSYWQKQRELFKELSLNDQDNNWLISDFVTLGSPLTYADILLLNDKTNFIKRKLDRQFPTSPPITEDEKWYFGSDDNSFLHHGAIFGAVKWTNIYMTHKCIWKGDLISGPVSRNFSYRNFDNVRGEMNPPKNLNHSSIQEIKLDFRLVKNGFTHTDYWTYSANSSLHLTKLREAVGLYTKEL